MSSLSGKTVLVTGASRGIGKALKSVCGAQGALIIPHASQPSANTDDSFIYEDLSLKGAGGRVFEAALEKYGRIDGVVNNAGVFLPSPLEAAGWDAGWETTLAVNVTAPADICRAAINRRKAVADIPLGRVAQPEEVAQMAAFLLSGACPSAVGATVDINGASYVR